MATHLWIPTLVLLVTAGAVAACEPTAAEPVSTTALSGLVVVVNPATGELILNPVPQQIAAVRSLDRMDRLSRSSEGLAPFALAGGGRGVFLEGRFQSSLVLDVGPDGQLAVRCVHVAPEEVNLDEPTASQPKIADR